MPQLRIRESWNILVMYISSTINWLLQLDCACLQRKSLQLEVMGISLLIMNHSDPESGRSLQLGQKVSPKNAMNNLEIKEKDPIRGAR